MFLRALFDETIWRFDATISSRHRKRPETGPRYSSVIEIRSTSGLGDVMTKSRTSFAAAALAGFAALVGCLTLVSLNGTAQAASDQAPRGDLESAAGCLGQTWPDISADCLVSADGSPTQQVRTVTIGYQSGDDTTVLVRMPAPQVAAN